MNHDSLWFQPPPPPRTPPSAPCRPEPELIEIVIDGQPVPVPVSWTILDACRSRGIDTPTLCYLENLTPVNACRVCVVELAGARTLVPACSRRVEPAMEIRTDTPRVRLARKMVLEFLASSVDLSTAPQAQQYAARYGACPERYGPSMPPAPVGERDRASRAIITLPMGAPRRQSPNRSRSTMTCMFETTRNASSATSASRRAVPMLRTPSPSRWRGGGSTPGSRRKPRFRCPIRPVSIAVTASASVPPGR